MPDVILNLTGYKRKILWDKTAVAVEEITQEEKIEQQANRICARVVSMNLIQLFVTM